MPNPLLLKDEEKRNICKHGADMSSLTSTSQSVASSSSESQMPENTPRTCSDLEHYLRKAMIGGSSETEGEADTRVPLVVYPCVDYKSCRGDINSPFVIPEVVQPHEALPPPTETSIKLKKIKTTVQGEEMSEVSTVIKVRKADQKRTRFALKESLPHVISRYQA